MGLNDSLYRQGRARFSSDELTVVLARQFGDGADLLDIAVATRPDIASPFGTPQPIENINSVLDDVNASVAPDKLTIYLESNRYDNYHIYVASRSSSTGTFTEPTRLVAQNGYTTAEGGPYTVGDGRTLYLHAYSFGPSDIYRGTYAGSELEAEPLTELNTSVEDAFPVVSSDERVIYFSSKRTGEGAKGGDDIWISTRESLDREFSAPVNLAALNTSADERPTWVSGDGCRLYFDRGGSANGVAAIYVAERIR